KQLGEVRAESVALEQRLKEETKAALENQRTELGAHMTAQQADADRRLAAAELRCKELEEKLDQESDRCSQLQLDRDRVTRELEALRLEMQQLLADLEKAHSQGLDRVQAAVQEIDHLTAKIKE
ncbi:hypothetical protein Agub_g7221, partial [Astrephomene gubernaculifera]